MPSLQLPHSNITQDSVISPEVVTAPVNLPVKMDVDTEEEFFPKRLPIVNGEILYKKNHQLDQRVGKFLPLTLGQKLV